MANSMEELLEELHAVSIPTYLQEKAEILAYYQDTYRVQWKHHIVDDLVTMTGLQRRSLMRRFQGNRISQVPRTAKARAEYAQLGQRLPAEHYDPPPGGLRIDFSGYVQISSECEERDFSEIVRGAEAYDLVNIPSFSGVMNLYFPQGLVAGPCGPWSVHIEVM